MALNFEITNLNLDDIIAQVEGLIDELTPVALGENNISVAKLTVPIDACIMQLQQAQALLNVNRAQKKLGTLSKIQKRYKKSGDQDAIDFLEATMRLKKDSDEIQWLSYDQKVRNNTKIALQQGLKIMHNLQSFTTGEVGYKIILAGKDLYETKDNLTLDELLNSSELEFSSKGGIALKIQTVTADMELLLKEYSDNNLEYLNSDNTMLNKMKKVELSADEQQIWDNLINIKQSLDKIEGSGFKLNYGNITEAFYEYRMNKNKYSQVDGNTYYELLEKSRNNLAYYYGGDVNATNGESWQIKALSLFGERGRADLATLSNIINPLKEISQTLHSLGTNTSSEKLKQSLVRHFKLQEGQSNGERPFKNEAIQIVKNKIKEVTGLNIT